MATYRTKDGDMIDLICWQYYGKSSGTVEAVLEANRFIADEGERLPSGMIITLPDLPASITEQKTVNLWD